MTYDPRGSTDVEPFAVAAASANSSATDAATRAAAEAAGPAALAEYVAACVTAELWRSRGECSSEFLTPAAAAAEALAFESSATTFAADVNVGGEGKCFLLADFADNPGGGGYVNLGRYLEASGHSSICSCRSVPQIYLHPTVYMRGAIGTRWCRIH